MLKSSWGEKKLD